MDFFLPDCTTSISAIENLYRLSGPYPLQPQPPAQRPGEREFVHEFEVAAEGHAAGQPGDYEVGKVAKHTC